MQYDHNNNKALNGKLDDPYSRCRERIIKNPTTKKNLTGIRRQKGKDAIMQGDPTRHWLKHGEERGLADVGWGSCNGARPWFFLSLEKRRLLNGRKGVGPEAPLIWQRGEP